MTRESKQSEWRKRVMAFERSGLTRGAWCQSAGVAVATLDYWRSRLRASEGIVDQSLVPILVADAPVSDRVQCGAGSVEIDLLGGLRLRADARVDVRWLVSVLRGLR